MLVQRKTNPLKSAITSIMSRKDYYHQKIPCLILAKSILKNVTIVSVDCDLNHCPEIQLTIILLHRKIKEK